MRMLRRELYYIIPLLICKIKTFYAGEFFSVKTVTTALLRLSAVPGIRWSPEQRTGEIIDSQGSFKMLRGQS